MNFPTTFRKSPAAEKAYLFLLHLIKEYSERGEVRLPTVAELSQEAEVSTVSFCKALARARDERLVVSSQKKGIRIVQGSVNAAFEVRLHGKSAPDDLHVPKWHAVKKRIMEDLFARRFPAGPDLPLHKELCDRYGVSFATLKKSLDALEQEKKIVRHKRSYSVVRPAVRKSRQRLVVIANSDSLELLALNTKRSSEFWRLVEGECHRAGLTIEVWALSDAVRNLSRGRPASPGAGGDQALSTLGYLVMVQEAPYTALHDTLLSLERTAKPVAIIDENAVATIPSIALSNPRMKLFVVATGTAPGRMVAGYLLGLGHRRIAYFSALKNDTWSINRFKGIADAYAEAGIEGGAIAFSVDKSKERADLFQRHPDATGSRALNNQLLKMQRQLNPDTRRGQDAFYAHAQPFFWNLLLEAELEPLFAAALLDPEITAWIGDNDEAALLALQYLKRKKIRVPEAISVVGFDDSLDSFCGRLTTYNFNMPALVGAVLDHMQFFKESRWRRNAGPVEIPGIIVERTSNGIASSARK